MHINVMYTIHVMHKYVNWKKKGELFRCYHFVMIPDEMVFECSYYPELAILSPSYHSWTAVISVLHYSNVCMTSTACLDTILCKLLA